MKISEDKFSNLTPRKIDINPGYRKKFWHKNCVAIGLSAGFLEPLEASAMMVIEASAVLISDHMPASREAMEIVSRRFNRRFHFRWQRIIDFLKLHYVLSGRSGEFWKDSSRSSSMSDRLKEDLKLWEFQAPNRAEFDNVDEAFPIASYQYVLYGMGYKTVVRSEGLPLRQQQFAKSALAKVERNISLLSARLKSNREILDLING